jgi:hypothetical protein
MSEKKHDSRAQIIVAIIGASAICITAIIGLLQPIVARLAEIMIATQPPTSIAVGIIPETPTPDLSIVFESPTAYLTPATENVDLSTKLYVLGYTENDLAVRQATENCKNCEVVFISSPNVLPDNWVNHAFNLASPTENLEDGCRSKQELINLGVTFMIANNYTPCAAVYEKSTFAILVGVTNQTNFNLTAASNYSYVANVSDVDAAILELSKVYSTEDIIYVVHVPELRATPGNPGSCKLVLNEVEKLKQYPLGWIIGGKNIIPSQYESSLQFCFGQ